MSCYCAATRAPCSWCESRYVCPECDDIVGCVDDFENNELCDKCKETELTPDPHTVLCIVEEQDILPSDTAKYETIKQWQKEREQPKSISPEWLDRLGGLAMILAVLYFLLR